MIDIQDADKYDESIAVWTDYFNKKFNADPPLDPDVVKALIASESGFRPDPSENKIALGITQITKSTLKIPRLKTLRSAMTSLRRNSFITISILLFICGCATSSFKVVNQVDRAVELDVNPSRVLLECEYQYDNDTKGAYGFLIRILDDENTVMTVAQTNILDKESCFRRVRKIGKILKTGKSIYIGAVGDLNEPRVKENRKHTFPGIGTFHSNGRGLQFIVIANEKGHCYGAYDGAKQPCPRDPFPLKIQK